jgi:hypothetical protein
VPVSWARLPNLQSAWVRPGNYQLCGKLPQQADFALCKITSSSTTCTNLDNLGDICGLDLPMQVKAFHTPATAFLFVHNHMESSAHFACHKYTSIFLLLGPPLRWVSEIMTSRVAFMWVCVCLDGWCFPNCEPAHNVIFNKQPFYGDGIKGPSFTC